MLSNDLEDLIINNLTDKYISENDLTYYKYRGINRFWRYVIDRIIFNKGGQKEVYTNKLKYNRYNRDMILICKKGCLVNVKWLLRNNIIFHDIHVMVLSYYNKVNELKDIFCNPIQLYNVHHNKSLYSDIKKVFINEIFKKYNTDLAAVHWQMGLQLEWLTKLTGPLHISVMNGNIEVTKLLLSNGFAGRTNAIIHSIKYRNLKLTTYLLVDNLSEIINNTQYNINEILNILNMLIIEYGEKCRDLLYYIVNSSLKINYAILKIIYNYSNKYELNDKGFEKSLYMYTINRIIVTNNKLYIKRIFNSFGLLQIIYDLIFNKHHHLCNTIIKKIIEYDHNYIVAIYEVLHTLYEYYETKSENGVNYDDYSIDYSSDIGDSGADDSGADDFDNETDVFESSGYRNCHMINYANNIILIPKDKYIYSLVNVLYNYTKLLNNENHKFTYSNYTNYSKLILLITYFIGRFQNSCIIEDRHYTREYSKEHIISDSDYKEIINLDILSLIKRLVELNYKIDYKECIKISVNFDYKAVLMYLVDKM